MKESEVKENDPTAGKIKYDVLCFSHLRWDFVYQRPQHLLSRFAKNGHRVFFIEEPIFTNESSGYKISSREENLFVVVPQISHETAGEKLNEILISELDSLVENYEIKDFISWYYTPMMLSWSAHLEPQATIFDSMDELSLFKFAPPELVENEEKLFSIADVVFTGGQSLFEAKKHRHKNIHAFPSSIDAAHFAQAFSVSEEPFDQKEIPFPRIGFFGVIDERMDIDLLDKIAALKPDFQFVMIGLVVKIDEKDLPRRQNIHYLGGKQYDELPGYLAGWDAAMMPFALNDSTRFISPTKTPEYLAAGKAVVSTPIQDVVRPYGENDLARIAATAEEFVVEIEKAIAEDAGERQKKVDAFLADTSWDKTFQAMKDLIEKSVGKRGTKAFAAAD